MFIVQYIAKIIKILRSGASPNQIAGGCVLGMIIGLLKKANRSVPSLIRPSPLLLPT